MRNIVATFFVFVLSNAMLAQEPSFEWSRRWVYATQGTDVDIDGNGNVYLISWGGETTNFNLSNGPSILGPTFGCAAVTKLDPSGNVIWIKFITVYAPTSGGIVPSNIMVKDGFIYVTGLFGGGGGTYDFDPGIGSATSNGQNPNSKGFVLKWDIDGNYVWHKTIETSISWPAISIKDMFVDLNDNVLICGGFTQTIISGGISAVSNGGGDCFFLKLDSMGNTLILKSFGGVDSASPDEARGMCANSSSDIYLVGSFNQSVDFDPGQGQTVLSSYGSSDVFVSKLNAVGELIWVKTLGNAVSGDIVSDIVLDESENIVFTGTSNGVVDFDLSIAVNNLNSSYSYAYIAKWNPAGEFIWAKGIYSDQQAQGMQLSIKNSNILITGICSGNTDFDPSINEFSLSSTFGGSFNTFLLNLSDLSDFIWAGMLNNVNAIANGPSGIVQSDNSILLCGSFAGTINSNPIFNQTNLLSSLTNNAGSPRSF